MLINRNGVTCFKKGANMSLRKFHTPLTEAEVERDVSIINTKSVSMDGCFYKAEQKKASGWKFSHQKKELQ
jgi:hypothetical protein